MSRNTFDLLSQAAELRAVGHTWAAVAERVHRKPVTCQKWTSRYRREWERLYRHAQLRRFDETSNEAHSVLKALLRDKDPKARVKAVEVWLKCGAGAYGRKGNMNHQGPGFEPGEENGLSRWAARQKGIDEDRAQMSRRRSKVAKAAIPLTAGLMVLAALLTGRSSPVAPDQGARDGLQGRPPSAVVASGLHVPSGGRTWFVVAQDESHRSASGAPGRGLGGGGSRIRVAASDQRAAQDRQDRRDPLGDPARQVGVPGSIPHQSFIDEIEIEVPGHSQPQVVVDGQIPFGIEPPYLREHLAPHQRG